MSCRFYENRELIRPLFLVRSMSMLVLQAAFIGCYGSSGKLLAFPPDLRPKAMSATIPALSARNGSAEDYITLVAMFVVCCVWTSTDLWFFTRYGRLEKAATTENTQKHTSAAEMPSFGAAL